MTTATKTALTCSCGGTATFTRGKHRLGATERLCCPDCDKTTRPVLVAPNYRHRPDLMRCWQEVAR